MTNQTTTNKNLGLDSENNLFRVKNDELLKVVRDYENGIIDNGFGEIDAVIFSITDEDSELSNFLGIENESEFSFHTEGDLVIFTK